jgi:hypothetical protein
VTGSVVLVLIAEEVTEAEQVTWAVDLAAARAGQGLRFRWLLRLQHGLYRARELGQRG